VADLKKQLILEVSLGTQKLKSEIESLKKDIQGIGKAGTGTSSSASKSLNEDAKKAKEIATAYKQRDRQRLEEDRAYIRRDKEVTREKERNAKKLDQVYDKQRQKDQQAATKDKQMLDKRTQEEIKSFDTIQRRKEYLNSDEYRRDQLRRRGRAAMDDRDRRRAESLDAQAELKKRLRNYKQGKDDEVRALMPFISSLPGGERITRMVAGRPGLIKGLGAAGGALGGFNLANQMLQGYDQRRVIQASQSNTIAGLARSGDFAGAGVMQNQDPLRGFMGGATGFMGGAFSGGLKGAALGAGVGSVIPGLGTAVGALAFGGIGALMGGINGAMTGSAQAQKDERERLMMETEPIRDAMARQRQLSAVRRQAARMSGRSLDGANPMQRMTSLQFLGTQEGFGQEETLNQLMQLGSSVGMNEAARSLPRSQYFMNRTGIDVGTQGALREAITGAERGTFGDSQQKMETIIRRGMAFGIKDGKLDQYARMTAEAVERNAALGGVQDADSIAAELASRARGLAGEGDITQGTLSRAADIQSSIRELSSQTQGIAGAGNFLAIQKAATEAGISLDPAQMLLMAQASNKGGGAMKEILGRSGQFSPEQIDKFVGAATSNKSNLTEMFPGLSQDMRDVLGNTLFGTTERTLDVAKSGRGGMADADAIDLAGRGTDQTGAEGELNRIQQQVDFNTFQSGMDNIGLSMKQASATVKTYSEIIERSAKKLEEVINRLNSNNMGQ
jgi:hypothetical protein